VQFILGGLLMKTKKEVINQSVVANGTILLFLFYALGFSLTIILVLNGSLSINIGMLINCVFSYVAFTPMHEAAHENIRGRGKSWKWLETIIGFMSGIVLMVPFQIFKIEHLRHHSFVNHPKKDPDYWVKASNPVVLILKVLSVLPAYYFHMLYRPNSAVKRILPITILTNFIIFTSLYIMITNWGWELPLKLWVIPAFIAICLLGLVFDWVPHHPHDSQGRYDNATIYTNRLLDIPFLYQNYHLIHHLYPKIPFYQYKDAFVFLQDELTINKARIHGRKDIFKGS